MIDPDKFHYLVAQTYNLIALIFCFLILFGKIDMQWNNAPSINSQIIEENNSINTSDCYNMTVPDTVDCVVEYVKTFYVYNLTDDSINLTFDELKGRGGDCKDWTEFYIRELSKYDIAGEKIRFSIDDDSGHAFANVHRDDWYCTIDQREYNCVQLSRTIKED